MSILCIKEYRHVATDKNGNSLEVGVEDGSVTDQTIDFSGGVASSAAFKAGTKFVRLQTDAVCNIKFGDSPTAVVKSNAVGGGRMATDQTEYFGVVGGQKVSVIGDS